MKRLVRKRYGYGLIGGLVLAIAVACPLWAGDAQAATKNEVELKGNFANSTATDSKGNTYWDLGWFDMLYGNARTYSNKAELDFSKVVEGDDMGEYIKDLRLFREIDNYIPGTSQEQKYFYMPGLQDMVDPSSNINFTAKDKGQIASKVTKVGEKFTLNVPSGVDKKDGVIWIILSTIEGYPFPFKLQGDKKETLFEIDTYVTMALTEDFMDEETFSMGSDGSLTILNNNQPDYATTYMCFSATKIKDEDGDEDLRLDRMIAAYNVANESDLKINEDKMELNKIVRLGGELNFKVDVTTSRKDKLEVSWGSYNYNDIMDYDNSLAAKVKPVTIDDMGVYYAMVTDGTIYKMVSFYVEQDPNDKYPTVANLKTLKVAAYNEKAVKITWNKATNAKKYAVYQWNGKKWVGIGSTTNNYYLIKNLKPGQAYKFAVRPYQNYYGVNVKSQTYKAINTFTKPNMVSKIAVTKRARNYVSLKWSKASGAKGYVVYQYANKKWVKIGTTSSNVCTVKGLRKNTSHYFAVLPYTKINGKVVYARTYTKVKVATTK